MPRTEGKTKQKQVSQHTLITSKLDTFHTSALN